MTIRRLSIVFLLLQMTCGGGCQVAPYEVVNIEIDLFDNFESNKKLAEEIVRYDVRYLAAKVPAYDESFAEHISIGARADTSGSKKAFVWIRYDYKSSEMVSKKIELKRGLQEYFMDLAESHARMSPIIFSLKADGAVWVDTLFSGDPSELYSDFAASFSAKMLPEEWKAYCEETRRRFGAPTDTKYLGGQFYEPFDSNPETISLFYSGSLANGGNLTVRVSEVKESEEWRVCGFGVYPKEED